MTTFLKVLGQSAPSATSLTTLYTVPANVSTVGSSIVVCNRGSSTSSFRVAVRPAGTSISNEQYIYYDLPITGNNTFIATIGITLDTTDVVSVYTSSANLSFTLFGQENS